MTRITWMMLLVVMCLAGQALAQDTSAGAKYSTLVHESYQEAYDAALRMQTAIEALLEDPTEAKLEAAKKAWLEAREPYGQTEVFRFYGGPIDGVGPDAGWPEGVEGPEGRLNAWPLNEAYIDYVRDKPDTGIVNDPKVSISRDALVKINATEDETDVTTGYHAIEFLLWGQDFSADSPGTRPASDYARGASERRREYLRIVTRVLVDDLSSLVEAWAPETGDNYRARFVDLPREQALSKILTGMATLSGFELASERMAVPLDSGDQEDEHSCFSDNTHRDFIANQQGIVDVYEVVVHPLLAKADPALDAKLSKQLDTTLAAMEAIQPPIDRILASPAGSKGRKQLEQIVELLYDQAELLIEAGDALDVEVRITGE